MVICAVQLTVTRQYVLSGGGLPGTYLMHDMHLHWSSEHTINNIRYMALCQNDRKMVSAAKNVQSKMLSDKRVHQLNKLMLATRVLAK